VTSHSHHSVLPPQTVSCCEPEVAPCSTCVPSVSCEQGWVTSTHRVQGRRATARAVALVRVWEVGTLREVLCALLTLSRQRRGFQGVHTGQGHVSTETTTRARATVRSSPLGRADEGSLLQEAWPKVQRGLPLVAAWCALRVPVPRGCPHSATWTREARHHHHHHHHAWHRRRHHSHCVETPRRVVCECEFPSPWPPLESSLGSMSMSMSMTALSQQKKGRQQQLRAHHDRDHAKEQVKVSQGMPYPWR
jgi:hypothetical protein